MYVKRVVWDRPYGELGFWGAFGSTMKETVFDSPALAIEIERNLYKTISCILTP